MAAPKFQYHSPVVAPQGNRVHAVTLTKPMVTACGREFKGWMIALKRVNCHKCKLAIVLDCRPRRRKIVR